MKKTMLTIIALLTAFAAMAQQENTQNNETMKKHTLATANAKIADSVESGYKKIETGVVEGYKKMETGVVEGYKKMETAVVDGYKKVEDKCVETLFSREGETVEEAKERMKNNSKKNKQ